AAGLMHSLLYFGFIGLFIVTAVSEINHQMPRSWKFLHGQTYQAYAAFGDAVGVMFLAGVVWAIGRRYVQRPYRVRIKTRPKGAMKPMPNLMETELETFGASTVEDFTWKQLLDTDACTVCGRCTSVCPAHATGKPLDPREIVLKVGAVMAATGPDGQRVSPVVGE